MIATRVCSEEVRLDKDITRLPIYTGRHSIKNAALFFCKEMMMEKLKRDDLDVICFTPSTVKVCILDTATSSIQMPGAVVWLTETYPHLYQMQLPGSAPIFPQRMGIE